MAKDDPTNRFGNSVVTSIPDNVPMFSQPGHKLRTSNRIVDRSALPNSEYQVIDTSQLTKLPGQKLETVVHDDQQGIVRLEENSEYDKSVPNQFTGPSFRTQKERFRFDGHKMLHHLDRIQAWQNGQRFAPVHIDMGLTKFCNTACLYCYAVVQNMTKGTMIGREALLQFIEDCGKLGVKSLGFIGDGEPTLNPALYDATVLAAEFGIDTSMATNGLLLDMDRAHDLLKNMSYIRFNLSAGTPEGFRRVHQSSENNFRLLIDNIRELVKIKRQITTNARWACKWC
jgi:Radical SAM superfamily.